MATLTPDDSFQRLTDLGVEFHTTDEDDVPDHLLALALEEGERQTRGEVAVDPPRQGRSSRTSGPGTSMTGTRPTFYGRGPVRCSSSTMAV